MKIKTLTLLPGLIGIATPVAFAGDCGNPHDPRYVYAAEIVRVYDGDTIFMDIDLGFRMWLRDEPLRLWGVDTPEVRGTNKAKGFEVRDLVKSKAERADIQRLLTGTN